MILCVAALLGAVGQAHAAGVPSSAFGVELSGVPSDLALGSAAGIGVARDGVFDDDNADVVVRALAEAHIRLWPILGVPCPAGTACSVQWNPPPAVAAGEMATIVTEWAQRYGPGGTFWQQNPTVPYLPIEDFEIGNEENIKVYWVVDTSHLHWNGTADEAQGPAWYADVYEAARSALHAVDPSGVAVVGGLADSGDDGVDVASGEQWLAALTPGTVDAVGYHDWVYDVSDTLMEPDTAALRIWMDAHGMSTVPLDVTEFGACDTTPQTTNDGLCQAGVGQSSAAWGSVAANYVQWAVCTRWLDVGNVQPFYWGATATTDQDVWLPLVDGEGALTAYGQAYLDEVTRLTTQGCPGTPSTGSAPVDTTAATVQGSAVQGARLTADPGIWSGSPSPTLFYQWERCDTAGQACEAIGSANGTSYTTTAADVGSTIVFTVTAFNPINGATASSAPTGVVAGAGSAAAAAPTAGVSSSNAARARAKASMSLRIMRLSRRGRRLTVTVRFRARSGSIEVTLTRAGRRRPDRRLRGRLAVPANVRRRLPEFTTMTFTARLSAGRWLITVAGDPAAGYAVPKRLARAIRLRAIAHHG
jgi:hypothetical protein